MFGTRPVLAKRSPERPRSHSEEYSQCSDVPNPVPRTTGRWPMRIAATGGFFRRTACCSLRRSNDARFAVQLTDRGPRPMETECEPGPSFGTSIRRSNRQVSSLQRLRAPGCPAPWPERSSMPSIFRQSSRGLLRPGSRSFVRWGRRTPNANASGSRCRQGQRSRAGSHTTSVPRDLPDFLPGRSADWRRKQRWAPGRVVVAVGDAGPQRAAPRARISSRKRRILC